MINSIITELETIANAFTSVQSFIYNRPSAVNWKIRTKGYPCILVDSQTDFDPNGTNSKNLIKKNTYTLRVFAYDEYQITEQNEITQQAKQQELQNILDQYIAEIRRRAIATPSNGFIVTNITNGFHAFPVHNDKLMQVVLTLSIEADSHCTIGTFNY